MALRRGMAGLLLTAVGIAAFVLWANAAGPERLHGARPLASDRPSGHDLAASLGLTPMTGTVSECTYFAEVEEGVGYCLDPVVSSDEEAWELSRQLQGRVSSELDRRIHDLQSQISELSPEQTDERSALLDQLRDLLIEKEQGGES